VLSMLVSILEQVQGNSIFHISWLYKGMFGCLEKKTIDFGLIDFVKLFFLTNHANICLKDTW
jgi:hypothetical protein